MIETGFIFGFNAMALKVRKYGIDIAVTSLKTQRRTTKMNLLIQHVKLVGDSAKDFLSTLSSIIHIARCLVSRANAVLYRDVGYPVTELYLSCIMVLL